MSGFNLVHPKRFALLACSLALLTATATGSLAIQTIPVSATETMLVHVDQAKILRLDHPAGTIIIGNPMIADASVQDNQMLVITGKSYGTTNMIILDGDGREILSTNLEVRYSASSQVTIQRGPDRYSYSCSPSCEPTLRIGDNADQFKSVKAAIDARIETATGNGGGSAGSPN